jgi:uncharacterized membrane-anchored protein YhcB (DUF1043 family)
MTMCWAYIAIALFVGASGGILVAGLCRMGKDG